LTLETARLTERLQRIEEEQQYLTERATVVYEKKEALEAAAAEEEAEPSEEEDGAAGGARRSRSGPSLGASSGEGAGTRVQALEAQMANMSSQLAAVLGALGAAQGQQGRTMAAQAAAPTGGGGWNQWSWDYGNTSPQEWAEDEEWPEEDGMQDAPNGGYDGATAADVRPEAAAPRVSGGA